MDDGVDAAIRLLENSHRFPDERFIKPHIKNSIDKWSSGEIPYLGSFLMAVMEDRLTEACMHADRYNLVTLPCIVQYVYMNVPSRARREGAKTWAAFCAAEKKAEGGK